MTKGIMRYSVLLIGFCLCSTSLFSQNWKIQQYTEEEGLPSNYLYTLTHVNEKVLMGSDAGLVVFDSHGFEVDNDFKNTYPIHLYKVSESLLYISTYKNGLYRKTKNSLKKISSSDGDIAIVGFDTSFILHFVYHGQVDTTRSSKREVINQLKKYQKPYRLVGSKEGVYYFKGKTIDLIDWQGNKKEIRNRNEDITIVFPLGENLFTGHKNGKIIRSKEGTESQSFQLDTDFDIQKMYKYDDSSFVVVNTKNEYDQLYFVRFNKDFTKILLSKKILNKQVEINDVMVKKGVIFCATYGEGLYVLSPTAFLTIDTDIQNIPRLQNLIQDEHGVIWGNSVQNVYKVDVEKGLSKLTFSPKLLSIFQTAKNKSYISLSGSGLHDLELNRLTTTSSLLGILHSTDSTIFGYGKYVILEVDLKQKTETVLLSIRNRKTTYGQINSGAFVDSIVYLGTDFGLLKLAKTKEGKWQEIEHCKESSYFNEKKITQTVYKGDTLFIIAEGSLFFYTNGEIEEFAFSSIADLHVNKIMFDSKSNLFIATNEGFWCIKPNAVLHYNNTNGLLSKKIYNFFQDRDSNIWVLTGKSLEAIKYQDLHYIPEPKLFIKREIKRKDGVSLTISSYQYDFPDDLELEYRLNDGEWIPIKTQILELRNLAPKKYKCYIRGKRNNSSWSSSLVYRFEVHAEWYQTNTFKFLSFLTVLLISFVLFKFRLKKIRSKNLLLENEIASRKRLEKKVSNLREEISQDFHDELGNKIAAISGISNTLITTVDEKNTSRMKEISKLSSEMYDSTKDFVWLLDPNNNNLKSLCLYLRDHGENYFDLVGNIDFFFNQKNIQEIAIPYEWMKNIVLTFKEITANVIKHSSATEVTMDVKLEGKEFTIEIYDNGQGLDVDTIKHGNGLKNIVARMQKLNAIISTDYKNGVHYSFKLKMK